MVHQDRDSSEKRARVRRHHRGNLHQVPRRTWVSVRRSEIFVIRAGSAFVVVVVGSRTFIMNELNHSSIASRRLFSQSVLLCSVVFFMK